MVSCSNQNKKIINETDESNNSGLHQAGPPVIVYKTLENYNDKVAVILNEENTDIVSYPGSNDVYTNGELAYPIALNDGYLLDKRGINEHVAFVNISYDTYSKAMRVFTKDQLFEMIINDDPLVEMYHCGIVTDYKDIEKELNDIIDNEQIGDFEKLK